MSWTDPTLWDGQPIYSGGMLITALMMNALLSDNMSVIKTNLDASGKLNALTSTELDDTSAAALTSVAHLGSATTYTAGTHNFDDAGDLVRVVLPVGADQWAVA